MGFLAWAATLAAVFLATGVVLVYGYCALTALMAGGCSWADLFLGQRADRPDPVNIAFTLGGIVSGGALWWRFGNDAEG